MQSVQNPTKEEKSESESELKTEQIESKSEQSEKSEPFTAESELESEPEFLPPQESISDKKNK